MKKIRWGILSTAKIGREKVIPAMQAGKHCEVVAIASRNIEEAKKAAAELNIPRAHGSYESLLNDASVDAVYIPLPNHMHLEWAIKSLQAGKHVLCEKPISFSAAEATALLQEAKQFPELKIMEAFMYRFHPQWQYAKKAVEEKLIGELKTIQSFFSYYNIDPNNIRNKKESGGGGLMDIGCYCISVARFIFGAEPTKVFSSIEFDPAFQTDRMASAILDFKSGTSTFTCSTQLSPYQRVNIIGTEARIEIEIPFNALSDKPAKIWIHRKTGIEEIIFDAVDQYTLQADLFSRSILNDKPVPTGLEDAVQNMKTIEALFLSASTGEWKSVI